MPITELLRRRSWVRFLPESPLEFFIHRNIGVGQKSDEISRHNESNSMHINEMKKK